jgi:hypothetical protein
VVASLLEIVELENDDANPRKCLRPSEIRKSEMKVQAVTSTVKENFVNPFDPSLDPQQLFNMVSGKPLNETVTKCLLTVNSRASDLANAFK